MNPKEDPSSMNMGVATSDHIFEVADKILSILNSEYWKNPCSDLEAAAIYEHLQGLTTELLTTFSESKKSARTGERICQNMLTVCKGILDVKATQAERDAGISQISQKTEQLATEAKGLEVKFQATQTRVGWILTNLPVPLIAGAAESGSIMQVREWKVNRGPSFGASQAFFSQVTKDLLELKPYLCKMISVWNQVHQQVTTMLVQAEKALILDISIACMETHSLYRDYYSGIENLSNLASLSNLSSITIIEKKKDLELEAILPSFRLTLAEEMQTVFESACHCVSALEPWNRATSQHPAAKAIIKQTQMQFADFFDLVSTSKDVAQKGVKLMENISHLCGSLLGPTHDPTQVENFIEEVIPEAEEAQRKSTIVRRDFRAIMVNFNQISNDIPMTVGKIEQERKQIQTASQRPAFIKVFLRSPASVGVEGGISLPFPLPFVSLVERAIETNMVNRVQTRKSRLLSAEIALLMLKNVSVFLSKVGEGIASFIKFWLSVNISLEAVKERVQEMRKYPKSWELRLELAQKQWKETSAIYQHYVIQIEYLSQFVPLVGA